MQRLRLAVVRRPRSAGRPPASRRPAGAQTRAGTARLVTQALDGIGGRSASPACGPSGCRRRAGRSSSTRACGRTTRSRPRRRSRRRSTSSCAAAGDRLRADYVRTSQGAARTRQRGASRAASATSPGVDANDAQPGHDRDDLRPLGRRPPRAAAAQPASAPARRHRAPERSRRPSRRRRSTAARTGCSSSTTRLPDPAVRRRAHRADRPPVDRRPPVPAPRRPADRRLLRLALRARGTRSNRVRVRFPRTVSIRLDGKVIHTETRSSIAVNRPASATRFRFPSGIAPRYSTRRSPPAARRRPSGSCRSRRTASRRTGRPTRSSRVSSRPAAR